MKKSLLLSSALLSAFNTFASDLVITDPLEAYKNYVKAVRATENLVYHRPTKELAHKYGLDVLNVTWEDTGRNENSSVGPNISDMTIQAHMVAPNGKVDPVAMPVFRYPNFTDKTADIELDKIKLVVGNENSKEATVVSLKNYLSNLPNYLSSKNQWVGSQASLLAERDTHVLVSAQSAFLPVPKAMKATFNPVLFNYQSSEKNPAVLAIVATREGTSATIIDNKRDAFSENWGQRLFFNQNGEKASFTAVRASDANLDTQGAETSGHQTNKVSGANMVMLIQVPLVHEEVIRNDWGIVSFSAGGLESTLEDAVIGHGPVEGPFIETDGLEIKRDTRFPIRVTVQFYKATDGSAPTEADFIQMRKTIDEVYKNADYVGSLVTEGRTGRPTTHTANQ